MSRAPLLRCLAIYRRMPWRFSLVALLFVAVHTSLAWQQWLLGRAIDDVSAGGAARALPDGAIDDGLAWHWLWLLVGVALVRGVGQYVAGIFSLIISQELLGILRERILVQVQSLDLGYHRRHGMGEIVTRATRDADKVRDALVNFWRQVVETPLVLIACVGLLFWYDVRLGAVPLLLTVIGLWSFVRQTGRLVVLDRAVGEAYDRVNQDLSEGISGVRVIKSFALEAGRIDHFSQQVGVFVTQARAALAYAVSRIPGPQVVVALGHVWVLAFGAWLVTRGELQVGELVASLLIVTTLIFRIEGIGRVMQIFADARSSAARIWELLDARPAIVGGNAALPEGPLGVRLHEVTVCAGEGGGAILENLSLQLAPGEIVALVGATGSGKSTLAALLPRLVEAQSGMVLLGSDAAGWREVRTLALGALRRRVHVVPQESFLFSDTLAANLRLGAPDADDEALLQALRTAAADEVLERLPDGLQTVLGDRGVTLSGGQRQRLSLARALLARPDVLGLDDATSALDAVTERRVLDNIRRLGREGRRPITVLVVGSKLSTILLADRVLLLAGGRIADGGTHEELAARNPAYRELTGLDHG